MGKEKEARKLGKKKRLCGIALAIIIVSTSLIYLSWYSQTDQAFQLKAVIIDQVALTDANDALSKTVTFLLKRNGYMVDYYAGRDVTVEFYRNLPSSGYSLIIMRTHSRPTGICTGELYEKSKYVPEQLTAELIQIFVGNESYFGITASFIRNMRENFHNTTILCMGCDSLSDTVIAEAFIEKGAKVFIGWKQSVLVSHTDTATTRLLIHLILERKTISQAVTETMTEMGPYPILDYYPHEAGEMKVIADG